MSVIESDLLSGNFQSMFRNTVGRLISDGASGQTVMSKTEWQLDPGLSAAMKEIVSLHPEDRGFRVVPGLLNGLGDPGHTPPRWSEVEATQAAAHDVALVLVASALGRPFGWAGQQDGRLVHNILPSPESAGLQVGASSAVPLAWHTEDAFHSERADVLLLACMRNPDSVGTRLASIRDIALSSTELERLQQPLAIINPDDSYRIDGRDGASDVGMSTVWSRTDGLCVRYDPFYTRFLEEEPTFLDTYEQLAQRFEDCSFSVNLRPGDLLVVDNDVLVHGRVAFRPRYDGTDRWLKRVLVRAPRLRPSREQTEHGYGQTPLLF
ncbi:TauD/TfdA family dioxygenase [Actinosynnema sp. CS-041913]|uniref:TauD/TfdA family dioxygenase n=1 Tax=Actinosynnema sp. CS-041913 TaxID=3239917 RepID=UPI003D8D3083